MAVLRFISDLVLFMVCRDWFGLEWLVGKPFVRDCDLLHLAVVSDL